MFRQGSFLDRLQQRFAGQTRGLPPPFGSQWEGAWGMPAGSNTRDALQAYGDNVWLHGAVSKIAFEIARTKFKLARTNKKGEIEYVKSHQALETLRVPQPIAGGKSMMTSFDLKYVTAMHMLLPGEGFWQLDQRMTVSGSPLRINIMLPYYVNRRIDKTTGDLIEYVYRTGQDERHFTPMDVVHFKLPDPETMYRGHSPVQSIRYALDTQEKSDVVNTNLLKNSARPGGFLKTEKSIGEPEREAFAARWSSKYAGDRNAGKTVFLPFGVGFEENQMTNQELQFVEGKNLTRDEILANYGVGLEMLGKTESQTRANAEAAVFVFMRFGVLPFIEKFADTLNNDYLPAFPGTDGMEFLFDDPVPENLEEKRANADSLFGGGALTPNERRKMFGMEPLNLPGMDVPYLPINAMPVGDSPPLTADQTNP